MIRLLFICICLFGVSFGQTVRTADQFLAEAVAKAEEAKLSYEVATFDQPLWRDAIRLGEDALALDPSNLNTLHFLATTHGYINWYSKAWSYWQNYFTAGGTLEFASQLDAQSAQLLEDAGTELGFARYEARNLREALEFYEAVLSFLPDNAESLRWAGRIHLELAEPDESLVYWERLTQVLPDDEGVVYYLRLAKQQDRVGIVASTAFQKGLEAYEEGNASEALELFEDATRASAGFADALAWAGRVSFELGLTRESSDYWQQVLELDPTDERAAYFARYAADRETWGTAADAFYAGQSLHLQNNLSAAVREFEKAYQLNTGYKDAAVWTARTYQELGQPAQAAPYWQAVLQLDPTDKRAQDFLRLAQVQVETGIEAGNAFLEGVAAFEAANLGVAESFFLESIDANPNYPDAWAWLGRVHFTMGDYEEAAEAYGKAYALEPANDGYRFFTNESLRLAENP